RKERKRGGGEYWYAYARVQGNLTKRYVGRDMDLTLTHLEQVAQDFWLEAPVAVPDKEGGASSQRGLASPTTVGEKVLGDSLSQVEGWSSDGSQAPRLRFEPLSQAAQHTAPRDSGVGGWKTENESGVGGSKARVFTSPPDRVPVIAGLPPDPLLVTKLYAPRPRSHLLHRPRLLQRLQQGSERALILLSALAGFGKCTLLCAWLTSSAMPAAWFSL